jgi:peptidoglycan L-alanyl-D-glutamate endopeptidase CwlK
MPAFGKRSLNHRSTLDTRLQEVVDEAIKLYDFSIICGHRGEDEQNKLFEQGRSQVQFPGSKHNVSPSLAFDVMPYRPGTEIWDISDPEVIREWYFMAGLILGIAKEKGIPLRWGGDWNKNYQFGDERFIDLPHFELSVA